MAQDRGAGQESFGLSVSTGAVETGRHSTLFRVEKWDIDQVRWTSRRTDRDFCLRGEPDARHFAYYGVKPFEVYEKPNANLILNAGWQMLMNGIAGSSVTKFASGSVGRIGGGISSTAAAYTQTDLQAATGTGNRQWEVINAAPVVGTTYSAGLVLAAQFPTTDGNFAWAEFGFDSGTSAGTGASTAPMLSRGTASPGTKTSSQTWNTTLTITWS
jgi:hypothetical protein